VYTIYKALSAAALAARLERVLARPVVPVFWVAGDDHDHAESAQAHILTAAHDVLRLALPERAADAPLTPMYRERLGPGVTALLDAVRVHTPASEFRDGILEWLGRHYTPAADVAGAFAAALAELLGPFGIVVFQPTHDAVKAAMRPLLVGALEQAEAIDRALGARARELEAEGAAVPVPTGDGATTVMLEGEAGRDRLMLHEGAFRTRRSGQPFTLDELRVLADRAPERLSPNVLLRPVVEAALLPTLAYVGGPGELAYLPQATPLYAALDVAPQVPMPRWSGLAVEARVRRVLDKYALSPDDLRQPEGQLEQHLVRGAMPELAATALATLRAALGREYPRLRDAAASVDPTLRRPVESAMHAAFTGLEDIERRILAHLKHQDDILVRQLANARQSLYPLGKPQERVLNVVPYLVRYGTGFLEAVHREIAAWVGSLEPGPRGA
jgi:bacillithiol biosynthesis cysteine-adding enzyme BshC